MPNRWGPGCNCCAPPTPKTICFLIRGCGKQGDSTVGIEGAIITVRDEDDVELGTCETDANGQCCFEVPEVGPFTNYEVDVEATGYTSDLNNPISEPDDAEVFQFSLSPNNTTHACPCGPCFVDGVIQSTDDLVITWDSHDSGCGPARQDMTLVWVGPTIQVEASSNHIGWKYARAAGGGCLAQSFFVVCGDRTLGSGAVGDGDSYELWTGSGSTASFRLGNWPITNNDCDPLMCDYFCADGIGCDMGIFGGYKPTLSQP